MGAKDNAVSLVCSNPFSAKIGKIMKLLIVMLLGLSVLGGCSRSVVNAGHEGVMTYQPYFFGSGGVDPDPIRAGAIWTAWSTGVERYDVRPIKL